MAYGVCKVKGTFLPKIHTLLSSLGPGIPCSSGPELDPRPPWVCLPNSFLDPRSVQRHIVSRGWGCAWSKALQADVSTHKCVRPQCAGWSRGWTEKGLAGSQEPEAESVHAATL